MIRRFRLKATAISDARFVSFFLFFFCFTPRAILLCLNEIEGPIPKVNILDSTVCMPAQPIPFYLSNEANTRRGLSYQFRPRFAFRSFSSRGKLSFKSQTYFNGCPFYQCPFKFLCTAFNDKTYYNNVVCVSFQTTIYTRLGNCSLRCLTNIIILFTVITGSNLEL